MEEIHLVPIYGGCVSSLWNEVYPPQRHDRWFRVHPASLTHVSLLVESVSLMFQNGHFDSPVSTCTCTMSISKSISFHLYISEIGLWPGLSPWCLNYCDVHSGLAFLNSSLKWPSSHKCWWHFEKGFWLLHLMSLLSDQEIANGEMKCLVSGHTVG